MQLFLAMSCLQGRPMHEAFDELAALGVDGIQLTPGNAPTEGFMEYVGEHAGQSGIAIRTHHGFTPGAMRKAVWSEHGALLGDWHSVHPPQRVSLDWLPPEGAPVCLEVMYPGLALGTGAAVDAAMDAGCTLAVDVSHINIQMQQGMIEARTWRRLQDYPDVAEIHLSANDGRRDQHAGLSRDAFGLDWARARAEASALPVILECHMHKLTAGERLRQVDIARGR